MAAQYKTPGVYVVEVDGFSSSVVEVPTAIPAFIGFTEYAKNGNQDLTNVPMPITSMVEFQKYYAAPNSPTSGAPTPKFTYVSNSKVLPPYVADKSQGPEFLLYYSMQLFFNNGGGNCYIVSIGSYQDIIKAGGQIDPSLFANALTALTKFTQPTMLVMPDAMMLPIADWKTLSQSALMHCNQMQCRIAILDVLNGFKEADGTSDDPISGADGESGFYSVAGLGEAFDKYGVAYYPWINTDIVPATAIDFTWLSQTTLSTLQADLTTESTTIFPPTNGVANPKLAPYQAIITALAVPDPTSSTYAADVVKQRGNHQTLLNLSPIYQQTMNDISLSVNLLPPSGAMAGVYTRNDNTFGVQQSPANTTIISANSPAVNINDQDQQNLNVPLNGLAVNAIRTFPNYGLLIWGARTMAGNSDDWRYVNVRRTMIMLEQSIKAAMQAYVFQSNDALTWTAVNSTITNFLTSQWKAGALVGAKASDAFSVNVGLGETMTGEDILNGVMNVSVGVAVVRPAEFIILTFQQQMQTS